jgi:hypothetical protein
MVTTNLRTYNNLQLLTDFTSGCELSTKFNTIVTNNDSNDDGSVSRSFTALSGSCAKLTTFPLSAC